MVGLYSFPFILQYHKIKINLAINAGESAWNQRKGIWNKYGDKVLLGYEYRMCIKKITKK